MKETARPRRGGAVPPYGRELKPGWRWALGIASPLAFLALWQALCSAGALGATPSPVGVAKALGHLFTEGDPIFGRGAWSHIRASLYRVACGFALAALGGGGLGLLMGGYGPGYYTLRAPGGG